MKPLVLLLALLSTAFAERSPQSERDQLVRQVPQLVANCKLEELQVLEITLNSKGNTKELAASCTSKCGQGGCPYLIFKAKNNRYQLIAEFFGLYKITAELSHDYYDLSIHNSLGSDIQKSFVLSYDGKQYK